MKIKINSCASQHKNEIEALDRNELGKFLRKLFKKLSEKSSQLQGK